MIPTEDEDLDPLPQDESGPLAPRLEKRRNQRLNRAGRGVLGAAAFVAGRTGWAEQVGYKNAAREELVEVKSAENTSGVASTRPIRYFSGPWNGDDGELLPVSWFLLWRSNVDWIPDPADFIRESDRRERIARRPRPEMVPPHRRVRPVDLKFKPARMRFRPRDVRFLRPIFFEKE
jgi:hypothetical protein